MHIHINDNKVCIVTNMPVHGNIVILLCTCILAAIHTLLLCI